MKIASCESLYKSVSRILLLSKCIEFFGSSSKKPSIDVHLLIVDVLIAMSNIYIIYDDILRVVYRTRE